MSHIKPKPCFSDTIFLDENTWLRDSLVQSFLVEIQKTGLIEDLINLHLNKRKFKGKKDEKIFDWLFELTGQTQRIWLITRDRLIYEHIPLLFRNRVYVCDNIKELKNLITKIQLFCIIIIILKSVNLKKEKLIKELISLLHNYIEEVVSELKFI